MSVCPAASITCTVKVEVAAVVGVPEMTPEVKSNERPSGNAPLVTLHTYGAAGTGTLSCIVVEYAWPTIPYGRAGLEEITGDEGMVKLLRGTL